MKLNDYIDTVDKVLDFPYFCNFTDIYNNPENGKLIDFRMKSKYGKLSLIYDSVEDVKKIIKGCLLLNKYKHDGLYNTTNLEYNPIWNVEGTETTTTTHGATETSNTYGDRLTEVERGERVTNSKYSEYPYDTKEKTTKNETDNVENAITDITTENGRTDTTSTTEYIDKTVLDRKGNIGVTSTQNLIAQERDCVNFVFWDIVINDVVKEITIPYYEEE